MLFAIDPGLRWCGLAAFDGQTLVRAELVRNDVDKARGPPVWLRMADAVKHAVYRQSAIHTFRLIIEVPRIYPHSADQKGDLNDLLELAGVVGALTGVFSLVSFVYPADWKGQLPKKVMNERVLKTLTLEEGNALVHHDHNTLDAVGIGLHHLGRLGQKKVFR